MEREEILKNVFYNYFEGHYKRNRLSINLRIPLQRETLTETALLPYLLERGCTEFTDITAIKRQLNMLYGATLDIHTSSMDYARILTLTIDGVDERYLSDEGIDSARADLLLDILFHPLVVDNSFSDEWVDIEREKLKQVILSEINDKRTYCLKKAGELFYGDDVRALPQFGFTEDLDSIDGKRLYEVYLELLQTASVEILSIGCNSSTKEKLIEVFSKLSRQPRKIKDKKAVEHMDEKNMEMVLDVEQDKYVMILSAGRLFTEYEQSVLRLANVILGSSPTSRLFMNVREKKSLCYYCASRPGYMSGALTIDSGVEYESVTELREAVLYEIEDIKRMNISDEELDAAKLLLESVLMTVDDTIESISGWYLNCIYRIGRIMSPCDELNSIKKVTKQEISTLMGLFKVNVSVLLRGEM